MEPHSKTTNDDRRNRLVDEFCNAGKRATSEDEQHAPVDSENTRNAA